MDQENFLKPEKLGKLTLAFRSSIISIFISFVAGIISGYGVEHEYFILTYVGFGLVSVSLLLLLPLFFMGFMIIAEFFKKRFLYAASFIFGCAVTFNASYLLIAIYISFRAKEIAPVVIFHPLYLIFIGFASIFFGFSLISVRNKFKILVPITSILIILSGTIHFFSLYSTFFASIVSLINFFVYILLLAIIYKSRKILKKEI